MSDIIGVGTEMMGLGPVRSGQLVKMRCGLLDRVLNQTEDICGKTGEIHKSVVELIILYQCSCLSFGKQTMEIEGTNTRGGWMRVI